MKSAMSLPALKIALNQHGSHGVVVHCFFECGREGFIHRAGDGVLAGDAIEGERQNAGFGVAEDVGH
jgi:hypothetical protein